MNKITFTVADFRKVFKQMVEGDRVNAPCDDGGVLWYSLCEIEQMSDEKVANSKLYADLGMDSIDVWELICIFERDYEVLIEDHIESALGTGVCLTVQSFLDAINSNQE